MTEAANDADFGWCILELLGHRRLGGYVREQEVAGHAFLRIDVPRDDDQPAATQFYPASAVYGFTSVTEAMARAVAANNQPEPVHRWELRELPQPTAQDALVVEEPWDADYAEDGAIQ